MRITNKDMDADVAFIIQEIKSSTTEIPSFFRCIIPGALFTLFFMSWQFFIFINYDTKSDPVITLGFSLFISFMVFLVSAQARGKYLSLPVNVRKKSLIINMIKKKVALYCFLWFFLTLVLVY